MIGEKVRIYRKRKGLTLQALAVLTDSAKSYIWEIEKGSVKDISASKLFKLACVLDVTMEYLVNDDKTFMNESDRQEVIFRKILSAPESEQKLLTSVSLDQLRRQCRNVYRNET